MILDKIIINYYPFYPKKIETLNARSSLNILSNNLLMLDILCYIIMLLYICKRTPKYISKAAIAKLLLRIPKINRSFRQKIKPITYSMETPPYFFSKVPLQPLGATKCFEIVRSYSQMIKSNLKSTLHSGTVYVNVSETAEDFKYLPQTIEGVYMYIMQQSYYWNNMHDVEFRPTYSIQRQLGWMVADLLGGCSKPFTCMHTTGGTQSIMTAARSYMNFGMKVKGLDREDVTIIALDTVHASLIKAQEAFGFNLVKIPTVTGTVMQQEIRKAIEADKSNVVAIFCSYPAYVYGKVDDINLFSKLALTYNIGLHIDCCLGGFIFNQLDSYIAAIMETPGLTSLSIDPHKNGLAPKGSSLLYCLDIRGKSLVYYSIYAIPDWKGGLYGSIKDEGSASFVEVFCTYITILFYGKLYYKEVALKINDTCKRISEDIQCHCYHIVDINPLNVLCFKLHPTNNNVSYHFASQMEKLGIKFSILTDGYIQFCVTPTFVSKDSNLEKFLTSFSTTINNMGEVDPTNSSVKMYSSVDIALNPPTDSYIEYAQNVLFGKLGIEESIKNHFMALLNLEHMEKKKAETKDVIEI